jgi:hypothetical protein
MTKKLPQIERLVQVNADSVGKRFYLVTFLTCFSIFLAMFFIAGFAVPDTFQYFEPLELLCPVDSAGYEGSCQDIMLWQTNRWRSKVSGITPYNAFLTVGAAPFRAQNDTLNCELISD